MGMVKRHDSRDRKIRVRIDDLPFSLRALAIDAWARGAGDDADAQAWRMVADVMAYAAHKIDLTTTVEEVAAMLACAVPK